MKRRKDSGAEWEAVSLQWIGESLLFKTHMQGNQYVGKSQNCLVIFQALPRVPLHIQQLCPLKRILPKKTQRYVNTDIYTPKALVSLRHSQGSRTWTHPLACQNLSDPMVMCFWLMHLSTLPPTSFWPDKKGIQSPVWMHQIWNIRENPWNLQSNWTSQHSQPTLIQDSGFRFQPLKHGENHSRWDEQFQFQHDINIFKHSESRTN